MSKVDTATRRTKFFESYWFSIPALVGMSTTRLLTGDWILALVVYVAMFGLLALWRRRYHMAAEQA